MQWSRKYSPTLVEGTAMPHRKASIQERFKNAKESSMMAHTFSPRTQEKEVGRSLGVFSQHSTVSSGPGKAIHCNRLTTIKKIRKKKKQSTTQ